MALGLYKPGQGYWMRVITAAMVGTLFLAMAMWIAGQAKGLAAKLPMASYSLLIENSSTGTTPAAGIRATLLGPAQRNQEPPILGTATVDSFDAENSRIVVRSPLITNTNYAITDTKSIRVDAAAGPEYRVDLRDTPRGTPAIQPILIQGIAASIVLIIGAIVTYWMCAVRPKTVDFLINTDMEMKKVNWSTRKDIIASTWVVIGSAFLIAAFIFLADYFMQALFRSIGVLKS